MHQQGGLAKCRHQLNLKRPLERSTSIRVVSSTLLLHGHGPVRFLTTNVIHQGSSWQYEGLAVLLVLLESLKFRSILTVRAQATCGIESSNEWACEVMWSQERYFSYRNQACCKRDSIAPCFRPQFWTDIGPFSAVERTNLLTTAKCILWGRSIPTHHGGG